MVYVQKIKSLRQSTDAPLCYHLFVAALCIFIHFLSLELVVQ